MKRSLVVAGLLAFALTCLVAGPARSQEKPKDGDKPLPLVAVEQLQVGPLSRTLDLTGTSTPTRQARLASPTEGPVQDCRVREGDQVKRGQRLVTIGRSGAAAAQVSAAAASLQEQEAELNRIKILVQSGAVPGSQLDSARAKYEAARALLTKARELARDYSIEAPWDGVVSKVLVKDGDFVAPRAPLVEMYDPSSLVIRLAVPEAQATEVFKGTPAIVQLDAYPGKTFEGKVSLVYPDLDTRMRTRTAEDWLWPFRGGTRKEKLCSLVDSRVSVGQALSELKEAMSKINLPVGYEISYDGQAQMMAEMQRAVLLILAFALFFAFVVLAVQFNSLKLPALILGSVPFCLAGMVYMLFVTGLPVGATVIIGVLIVVAATVNEGVLLLTFAEEIRKTDNLTPLQAVINAAKIRLRPRMMIALAIIFGFIPLALNLEDGGEMLQPMAAGAIDGLSLGLFVALFLMPCLYVMFTRSSRPEDFAEVSAETATKDKGWQG